MNQPLIRMDRVRKEFGRSVVAVDNMSLTIEKGDFISFLGPSGCGKSTALRMIAGLLPVTAGTIDIKPPEAGEQAEQDLGFVFQEPTLMPWARVFDNVWLPLRLAGVGRNRARERVEQALREVGLSKFERAYPRELSGGMKMRVSIARAMVTRPRILLMDEPFAALDEMTRMKLNNDVVRLSAEHGLTVVFVTHSVFESVYLSNRIVVMAARPGRVAEELQVGAPWPRGDDFRTSQTYADECRRVSAELKETLHDDDIDH
ncbi:nitrate/sulfonate/bicarbonate ABC transporter ATP-binding protein [Rhodobacteraceae bacterium WD3A24]|nr:nitrate/sulfonate/bicarbonate ABC transporter ATP-binding protein [Rhodobacteraceae bacterium WD3A24]